MQISGRWLLLPFHALVQKITELSPEQVAPITQGWYIALSFAIALILSLILTSRDKDFWNIYQGKKKRYLLQSSGELSASSSYSLVK